MIQQLVDSNKRQNMLIHRLTDKVDSLTITPPLPVGWQLAGPQPGLTQPPTFPAAQPSTHPSAAQSQPHLSELLCSPQSGWTSELQEELSRQLQEYARIQLFGNAMLATQSSPSAAAQPAHSVPAAWPTPSEAAALPSLLSLHLQPPTQQTRATRSQPTSQQTFSCNDCRYRCSDFRNLDLHIATKHQRPHHNT